MRECKLYETDDKKKKIVRCLACAQRCLINENKTGICAVRKNLNGKLCLLVYGKLVAVHIDPIEKKPLYHFLPGTYTFSIGTVGCNLSCSFCQNYDISQISKKGIIIGDKISSKKIVEKAISTGCKSIAYTYNEPVIFVEFVKDTAVIAKNQGLKNIMVTNGYWSEEVFDYLKDYIDAVNIDLKGNDEFYKKYCGAKSAEPVKETIKKCYDSEIHIEITTLVISGMNDNLKELEEIAKFIASINKNIPWHISRFFPMYKVLDKNPTPIEILKKTKEIGERYLKYVYVGNV